VRPDCFCRDARVIRTCRLTFAQARTTPRSRIVTGQCKQRIEPACVHRPRRVGRQELPESRAVPVPPLGSRSSRAGDRALSPARLAHRAGESWIEARSVLAQYRWRRSAGSGARARLGLVAARSSDAGVTALVAAFRRRTPRPSSAHTIPFERGRRRTGRSPLHPGRRQDRGPRDHGLSLLRAVPAARRLRRGAVFLAPLPAGANISRSRHAGHPVAQQALRRTRAMISSHGCSSPRSCDPDPQLATPLFGASLCTSTSGSPAAADGNCWNLMRTHSCAGRR